MVHFVGDLGPSKWDFWRCESWKMCVSYQDICFWWNCLHVANVAEFIATESGTGQERFANLLFSSLHCHLGEKLSPKKGIKQCLGGLKCSQNTKKNKRTLKVSFKAIFNLHFANLVSKEYFSIQSLIIFLLYE